MTASEMFNTPIEGMPSEVRRRAKAINFGIIYGISAFGLANQLGIERSEAGEYIKTYFARFPGIQDYMAEQRRKVKQDGFVETIFGRKVNFPNANSTHPAERSFVERASINAPIQGSAADIIRRAMIRMEPAAQGRRLRRPDAATGPRRTDLRGGRGQEADVMPVIVKTMETASEPAVRLTVPIKVDAHAARGLGRGALTKASALSTGQAVRQGDYRNAVLASLDWSARCTRFLRLFVRSRVYCIRGLWGSEETYLWKRCWMPLYGTHLYAFPALRFSVSLFGINSLEALKLTTFENSRVCRQRGGHL